MNGNPKLPDIYGEDQGSVRLGLCQVFTEAWDIAGNFKRTLEGLEQAADQGAELAITPECVLHGYGFGENQEDTRRRLADVAETLDGPRISLVRELARNKGMYIVLGFAERDDQGAFRNSAAIISSSGAIVDVYRKIHCRNFEDINHAGAFTVGDRFISTDIRIDDFSFRMGTMICFDREIPESTRCLRAMGSHLIACPLACDTERLDRRARCAHNELITMCRAAENEVFIAVVNHSGRFNGGSFVVGPGGEVLVQLGSGPEVKTIGIPVAGVIEKIHSNPFGWMGWGYRREEVYVAHLTRRIQATADSRA